MRVFDRFAFLTLLPTSLILLVSAAAFGAGSNTTPGSPRPNPAPGIKVWTNDDLVPPGAHPELATEPAKPAGTDAAAPEAEESPARIEPGRDPKWYAKQLDVLETGLADVSNQEEQLRQFRETGQGLPTGLNIAAPCQGVSTDNRIAQLEEGRLEIDRELDALADTARVNGMPPGILVEGRGRVSLETAVTPEEQRATLVEQYRNLSGELAETQSTIEAMNAYAAYRRMSLLEPDPRWGGNMTANLLQRLKNRQEELESEAGNVEDQARRAGLAAGALR